MLDTATEAEARFRLRADSSYVITISQRAGTLSFGWDLDGPAEVAATVAYDADDHRYWQIREVDDMTYLESSADASAWVVHATTPSPDIVSALRVELSAGSDSSIPAPGTVHFDNLNTGPGETCE